MSAYALSAALAFGCVTTFSPTFTLDAWQIAQHAPLVITSIPAQPAATAPIPVPALHQEPEPVYPLALDLKVEDGDTLTSILTDAGVSYDEAQRAMEAVRHVYNVRKLDIGQNVSLTLNKNPESAAHPLLAAMSLPVSVTSSLQLTRQDNGFSVKIVNLQLEHKLARAGGRIENSLYETGTNLGIPAALVQEIISTYSYDVDFQRDIQPGNRLDVLFEQMQTESGKPAGHGALLFADLNLGDRDIKIYRFVDKDGHADYYNEKGESIRKALLRTPIPGARITSGYGMRFHPILGYSRMHRGVDFGAPIGTPIFAAGDGVVKFEGWHGGYGNFLLLQHNAVYSTAYGHISHFAHGIHAGSHVRQGQIVAYVGETGMATGPHLHFEVRANGSQVNPANVKFKTGIALRGRELIAFRNAVKKIDSQLASVPSHDGRLAMAQ